VFRVCFRERAKTGKGRDVTDALPGSPPQTSPWRWAAWKQPVVTASNRPSAVLRAVGLTVRDTAMAVPRSRLQSRRVWPTADPPQKQP
jgi:hypothetical protein